MLKIALTGADGFAPDAGSAAVKAVELAKAFGSDNSSKFVNGVLGTAYRTLVEDSTDDSSTEV